MSLYVKHAKVVTGITPVDLERQINNIADRGIRGQKVVVDSVSVGKGAGILYATVLYIVLS